MIFFSWFLLLSIYKKISESIRPFCRKNPTWVNLIAGSLCSLSLTSKVCLQIIASWLLFSERNSEYWKVSFWSILTHDQLKSATTVDTYVLVLLKLSPQTIKFWRKSRTTFNHFERNQILLLTKRTERSKSVTFTLQYFEVKILFHINWHPFSVHALKGLEGQQTWKSVNLLYCLESF